MDQQRPRRDRDDEDEWAFASDKATGNVYFYNRRTRETRWTLPAAATSSSSSKQEDRDSSALIASLAEAHALLKREHFRGAGSSSSSSSIKEAVDPNTNLTYYYDARTKETFWEDPRGAAKAVVAEATAPLTQAPGTPRSTTPSSLRGTDDKSNKDRPSLLFSVSPPRQPRFEEEEEEEQPHKVAAAVSKHVRKPLLDEDLEPSPRTPPRATTVSFSIDSQSASPPPRGNQQQQQQQLPHRLQHQFRTPPWLKPPAPAVAALPLHQKQFNRDHLRLIKKRIGQLQPAAAAAAAASKSPDHHHIPPSRRSQQPPPSSAPTAQPPPPSVPTIPPRRVVVEEEEPDEEPPPPVIVRTATAAAVSQGIIRPTAQHSSSINKNNMTCLRKSGCTCMACSPPDDDAQTGAPSFATAGGTPMQETLFPCALCSRKFSAKSLAVHQRVCAKVFTKPAAASPPKAQQDAASKQKKKKPQPKWRKQSEELRMAMARGRGEAVVAPPLHQQQHQSRIDGNQEEEEEQEEEADDGLVRCPHCGRKFNDQAAERHIPKCASIVNKPKTLRRGEGGLRSAVKPPAVAPPPPPAAKRAVAPSMTPRGPPKPWQQQQQQQRRPGHQLPPAPPSASSQSSWDDYS